MIKLLTAALLGFGLFSLSCDESWSKGPLTGKSLYIPYLIYYGFNGTGAQSGRQFELNFHLSQYYTQDFSWGVVKKSNYDNIKAGIRYYDRDEILRDYESLATELEFSLFITSHLQAGIDYRFYGYYSGFLDPVIEGFHQAFGFPGGGRESYLPDQIYIHIPNDNGVRLYLDRNVFAPGDLDLWMKWVFFENRRISLAMLGAFKIPAGNPSDLGGSGFPDLGFNLMADFRVWRYLTFYVQSGVIFPFDGIFPYFSSRPFPYYSGLVSLEFHPVRLFSLLVQLSVKSMPVHLDSSIRYGWNEDIAEGDLPQTNIMAGFKFQYKNSLWQFYFEEDAFTNQGADITLNLLYSLKMKLH